jgi:dTDP-4-amino-4,6-dideoxygalactose transaminase
MDETLVEAAITPRTRAILPVHYAGVGCEMDTIMSIAEKHGLLVLEDAAQCILSYYKNRHIGSLGQMGALSFHETKNIHCGEGGALLINDPAFVERAEIVMEKGTDRSKFFRGEIDKYTWVDVGSSYLVNEISASFLWAQLEEAENIVRSRLDLWNQYHEALAPLEAAGLLRRPVVPEACARHNAHIYYVLFNTAEERDATMSVLYEKGIKAVFHYVPLHSANAGKSLGTTFSTNLPVTTDLSCRLLRLPLFIGLSQIPAIVMQIQVHLKRESIELR